MKVLKNITLFLNDDHDEFFYIKDIEDAESMFRDKTISEEQLKIVKDTLANGFQSGFLCSGEIVFQKEPDQINGFEVYDKYQNKIINWFDLKKIVTEELCFGDPRIKFEDMTVGSDGSLYFLDAYGNWVYASRSRFEVRVDE